MAASPGIILPIHIMVICQRVIRRGLISPRINLALPLNNQWAEYLFPQSSESESQRRRSETDLLLLAVTVLLRVVLVFREICGAGEE